MVVGAAVVAGGVVVGGVVERTGVEPAPTVVLGRATAVVVVGTAVGGGAGAGSAVVDVGALARSAAGRTEEADAVWWLGVPAAAAAENEPAATTPTIAVAFVQRAMRSSPASRSRTRATSGGSCSLTHPWSVLIVKGTTW